MEMAGKLARFRTSENMGSRRSLIKVKFKAVVNAAQNEPTELDLLRCHHDIVK